MLDIDSPVAPRVVPNGLLATGSAGVRSPAQLLGKDAIDSDSEDDVPLSLDFLVATRVDKGKRRATDDVGDGATGEPSGRDVEITSYSFVDLGRTLKRSRTANDELSSPVQHPRAALTSTRSLSVLSESIAARAPPAGGMTAAEKRALKILEVERAKAEKAIEKEKAKQRLVEERERKKRDQEVNKVCYQSLRYRAKSVECLPL